MKVKLLTSMAGPGRDESWPVGSVYDCSTEEAHRLIERELAEPLKPAPESTMRKAPENAMARRPRARKE